MPAPWPERATAELLRVSRPGSQSALFSWTPRSLSGQRFLTVCRYAPLLPNLAPPILWGVEASVRDYLHSVGAEFRASA